MQNLGKTLKIKKQWLNLYDERKKQLETTGINTKITQTIWRLEVVLLYVITIQ